MRSRIGGSALIAAIMLLLLLATLAAYLVHFIAAQQEESGLDVQGVRALYAARAGVDWGLYRALVNGQCNPGGSIARPWPCPTPPAWPSFAVEGFTVTVLCESTTADENGVTLNFVRLTATACNQPDGGGRCPNNAPGEHYVERQWQASAAR